MKLRKGQATYKHPKVGMLLHAFISLTGKYTTRTMLQPQPWGNILALPQQQMGRPRYIAYQDGKVRFWPKPDRALAAKTTYYPPAQEF